MMDSSDDYIVFGKPKIGQAEIDEVVDSLQRAWLGTGPKAARFERDFAAYVGAEHAVALNSCTSALFLAMRCADISDGEGVITTPMTFVATANSIRHCGAEPVFVDVDRRTGLLTPDRVEEYLTTSCRIDEQGRTFDIDRGIPIVGLIPVHLWGAPADMAGFSRLADQWNLVLIEDAAHAIEAWSGDDKIGTTADMSCFSFYSTKNLCTGEGGMITTASEEYAVRARRLAQHGLDASAWRRFSDDGYRHYVAVETGYKMNMMDLQAALGIHQLARLDDELFERERQWLAYLEDLDGLPGVRLPDAHSEHGRHARHLFTIDVGDESVLTRDELMAEMHRRGVGSGVHYLALCRHPAYGELDPASVPDALALGDHTLSLPLGGALTESQRRRVVDVVRASCSPGRLASRGATGQAV